MKNHETSSEWEIICPDGRVRHLPYGNFDDATHDAAYCTERRSCGEAVFYAAGMPPCPQGQHKAYRRFQSVNPNTPLPK